MENSMEEAKKAFEKVENLIKKYDECKLKECINCQTKIKRMVDERNNLLVENQKLKQENEELREKKKNIEPVLIGNKMYFIDESLYEDLLNDIKNNYIPVQKVKEKIEELDIEISICEYADDDSEEYKQEVEKNKAELLMARKVLQQLLEESVIDK